MPDPSAPFHQFIASCPRRLTSEARVFIACRCRRVSSAAVVVHDRARVGFGELSLIEHSEQVIVLTDHCDLSCAVRKQCPDRRTEIVLGPSG